MTTCFPLDHSEWAVLGIYVSYGALKVPSNLLRFWHILLQDDDIINVRCRHPKIIYLGMATS